MADILVAALYQFTPFEDFERFRMPLLEFCKERGIRGSLLLAREGINGTVAGEEASVRALLAHLRQDERFSNLTHKESWAERIPFRRMKVRLKKEIVNMGVPAIDPLQTVGTYVKPEDWNDLIQDPEVVLIDTRNDYEVAMGTFKGAIDPETESFKEFPDWVRSNEALKKGKKVAMFCTGGIRCEKATALMLEEGFDEVYHLEGGILNYLEKVPEGQSFWEGECFVFDDRVSVDHKLKAQWGRKVPDKTRRILADYMINEDKD
ncbi:oxygen-dependent tRNA uridine(34) hydroxylase TrhO [Pseudovibrio exalbescens]|uniref:oxygen-dependent tRNA uridine(34) hydroxylase TrhO n=1 Tax=Pseudovibrio exalbescens TaxID=197461 RepID=UPI000C9D1997|nr:rhodanese-related sulfurtransferase [Pseudovibrio exalbescens]